MIDLRGQVARKAYVLLSAFITNQHAFSTPFVLEFEAEKEDSFCDRIVRVPLNFPGDLDIGLSGKGMYGFPSFVEEPHGKRNVLPALPKPGDPDYPEAFPPDYPQHLLWNMRPAFQVNETVFSIVEVSLPKAMPLKRLHLTVTDAMAAAGIYAVTLA